MRLLPTSVVLGLFAVLMLAALPAPGAAQAQVPTLVVGHAVGYGLNLDLTALAAGLIQQIRQNPGSFGIVSIQELNFTGSFDAWVYEEVQSKTDTYYVLARQTAQGLKVHLEANVTLDNLPAPGTYPGTESAFGCLPPTDVPTVARSVEVRLDLSTLVRSEGTSRWTVSDYAWLGETDNTTTDMRGAFLGRGLPNIDFNATACTETITYEDVDLTVTENTVVQIRAGFSPALDVYDFPMGDNETWHANATGTYGATLSGTIDVQGLEEKEERAFFENLTMAFQQIPGLAVTGIDRFPIDLAQIRITAAGAPILEDGVLHDQTTDVELHLRAKEALMTLGDGQLHTVYRITPYYDPSSVTCPPLLAMIYSPDDGMIAGYQVLTCVNGTEVPLFELQPVAPEKARDNIRKTEQDYASVSATQASPVADFFLKPPFLGVLLVAVAVLVVAYVLMRRRRKPAPVAPPVSPEAPPAPPPSPPGPP